MHANEIQLLTPHDDMNGVLAELSSELTQTFGDQLVGLHHTGSLTYGDFDRGSSDIDYLVILKRRMVSNTFDNVKALHTGMRSRYPEWSARIEGSYVTEDHARLHRASSGAPTVRQWRSVLGPRSTLRQ